MKLLLAILSLTLCAGVLSDPVFAKSKKGKSSKMTSKKPFTKSGKRAICPRGLEDQDIAAVFKGYSYEGFLKAANEGEPDLMNGMMRKPWGFYKGLDGVQYAVYAFKPEAADMASIIDVDKLAVGKMLRIKLPEYCALYTEVSPEEAKSQEHEPVGLVISKDSSYKPKPLDKGAMKVEAVRLLIKNGVGTSSESEPYEGTDSEGDGGSTLTRNKKKGDDAESSESKIFEELNQSNDESSDEGDKEQQSDEKVTPEQEVLDGDSVSDKSEVDTTTAVDSGEMSEAADDVGSEESGDSASEDTGSTGSEDTGSTSDGG